MKWTIGLLVIACCIVQPARSQIREVLIGVDGLTCSQCTRSVEVKLRQLPFVADVTMDLANTSGRVALKPDQPLRPAAIPGAVKDAGFTIRYLRLVLHNADQYVHTGKCLSVDGLNLQLDSPAPTIAASPLVLGVLGAPYDGKKAPKVAARSACGGGSLRVAPLR